MSDGCNFKVKKLEILSISDIKSISNSLLSTKTNHYLQNMLFSLRLLFRYNDSDLDDLIDFYYYIEDLLNNKILLDMDELKILIYRVTDLTVNLDDYDINGVTLIGEVSANLLQSLYLELDTYRLVEKCDDSCWHDILLSQIKNQVVDFDILINIYEKSDDDVIKGLVLDILKNNYPMEFSIYNARKNVLEW